MFIFRLTSTAVNMSLNLVEKFFRHSRIYGFACAVQIRKLHLSRCVLSKPKTRRPKVDEENLAAVHSQSAGDIISPITRDKGLDSLLPDEGVEDIIFGNRRYEVLPVVTIKARSDNTFFTATEHDGTEILSTCGLQEGYTGAKTGTSTVGQIIGRNGGLRCIESGMYPYVRVIVDGIGAGRLTAIRGLQLAGIKIASITDRTQVFSIFRPKKQRRI